MKKRYLLLVLLLVLILGCGKGRIEKEPSFVSQVVVASFRPADTENIFILLQGTISTQGGTYYIKGVAVKVNGQEAELSYAAYPERIIDGQVLPFYLGAKAPRSEGEVDYYLYSLEFDYALTTKGRQ